MKSFFINLMFIALSISGKAQYLSLNNLIEIRKYSLDNFEEHLLQKKWLLKLKVENAGRDKYNLAFRYEGSKDTASIIYNDKTNRLKYNLHGNLLEYRELETQVKKQNYEEISLTKKPAYMTSIYRKDNVVIEFTHYKKEVMYNRQDYCTIIFYTKNDYYYLEY